jgi:glucose/mannose-6-phosphate isomerase
MLDDLKLLHERDAQDALGMVERQYRQLSKDFIPSVGALSTPVQSIVFAGMGSSAISAAVAITWLSLGVPSALCQTYDIPSYVGKNTVFFAISYSGNTAETLSAVEQAAMAGATIIVCTSGGKLADIAKARNYALYRLPTGLRSRHAVLLSLKAICTATDQLGLSQEGAKDLTERANTAQAATTNWLAIVPAHRNLAKHIAQEVVGRSIVISAGCKMFPSAQAWKNGFNETAKQLAWTSQVPESDHSELISWSKQPVEKPYAVIELRSTLEHMQVQKSFELRERLLSGMRPQPIIVVQQGKDVLDQLLWSIILGDFVTTYTAILNGLNPTSTDLINSFKNTLNN